MSGWQRPGGQATSGSPGAPPWVRPAELGSRVGAWLIDLVLICLLGLVPAGIAIAAGGLGWNAEAVRQVDKDPFGTPTVPWLAVQITPLVAAAVAWVVLAILYGTIGWSVFRGQPGQRLRSLQVADWRTGKNLPLWRALLRAIVVNGIPASAAALTAISVAEVMAIVPANATTDSSRLYSGASEGWATLVSTGSIGGLIWSGILLLSTAASPRKQGLQDRISGSLVVAVRASLAPWGYGYGRPMPGPYDPRSVWPPAPTGSGEPPAQSPRPAVWTGLAGPAAPAEEHDGNGAASESSEPAWADGGFEQAHDERETAGEEPDRLPDSAADELGPKLPEGLRVASFRRRMTAYGLDAILVFAVYSAIEMAIAPPAPNGDLAPERLWMLAGLVGGLAQALYFVGGWMLWRGSPGQKAVGLQVGRESDGGRLGVADGLVRWAVLQGPLALWLAAPYVTGLVLFIVATGWSIALVRSVREDPGGRGYHDRIAGSLVVEEA